MCIGMSNSPTGSRRAVTLKRGMAAAAQAPPSAPKEKTFQELWLSDKGVSVLLVDNVVSTSKYAEVMDRNAKTMVQYGYCTSESRAGHDLSFVSPTYYHDDTTLG